jgi:hypothetical protein
MGHRLPYNYKTHVARQLLESITEASNTEYYMFCAEHVERSNTTLTVPDDTVKTIYIDSFRNMIFGKRVSNNDMSLMIRNIPYEANKVYTMYDDQDDDLYEQDFYCVVDEISFYHVFKCLDNNLGVNSTVEPQFVHVSGSNTSVYQTSDGYRWKYMYSIPATAMSKFSTEEYIPVVPNTVVSNNATAGSIDIIKITNEGKNYGNYVTGTFTASDVRYDGDSTLYRISNTSVNQTNGYYTNCLIYISSGTGSGQYKTVTNYYVDANGSFVVVNSSFSTAPTSGSEYEVYPKVNIVGDGGQTTNAVARALINSTSTNSVYRVEMLNRGADYKYASATVLANSVVGVTSNAEVRPIYVPSGGHGKNQAEELACSKLAVSVNFSNSESNTIPTTNGFDKIGIIKNPLFANVNIEHSSTNGTFLASEVFHKITPVRINKNCATSSTSAAITCSDGDFVNQLSLGDWVYLKSSNGLAHQVATISSITNSSYINISSNALFTCTETIMYQANISSNGYIVSTPNATNILVTNVHGQLFTNDIIIGYSTGATAVVNTISRSSVDKNFDTYVGMYKYIGTIVSGSFDADEYVYQGANLSSSFANGVLHSAVANGGTTTFYVSNVVGIFNTSNTFTGANSGATASLSSLHVPEIVQGTGTVIYLENLDTVPRQNNQSETLKIILSFDQE